MTRGIMTCGMNNLEIDCVKPSCKPLRLTGLKALTN